MDRPDPLHTALCELLGIRHPVLLAGMAGGPPTPELVAAVSRGGGPGTFGLTGMSADAARAAVARARELTDAPIAVNVLVAPPEPPHEGAADPAPVVAGGLEAGAGIVSVGLGDPSAVADLARIAGAPLLAMAASVEDAVRAAEA